MRYARLDAPEGPEPVPLATEEVGLGFGVEVFAVGVEV